MAIILDGTNGISTPDLESAGPVTGTTGTFSGNVTLGSSVLATPTGSAPSYTCRAWVNFNGTGTVAIRASGNVSSITDNGTGTYTVNFATAMPDVNYGIAAYTTWSDASANAMGISGRSDDTKTVSALKVWTTRTDNFVPTDSPQVNVSIFR